jgi:hypothetical protein
MGERSNGGWEWKGIVGWEWEWRKREKEGKGGKEKRIGEVSGLVE